MGDRSDLPNLMPRDDAGLKALAKQLGCAKKDLMVLSGANDPYNVDTATKRQHGEWFAELWQDFGYSSGVHSRRVHYHASVTRAGEVFLPDGRPYLNDDPCWRVLAKAAVSARDLGIIDPALFIDRRNQESTLFASRRLEAAEPGWSVELGDPWRLPMIHADLSVPAYSTGLVEVEGYDYEPDDQPYLTELWIEKSTMDDVLGPVCRRLGTNFTPGKGFTSRTRVCEMLHRARRHGKPVRVFLISDYDPGGSHMPRSIARAVEYYRDQIAPDVQIAIHNIGMTVDWASRYELPRAPSKPDRRKANFERVHGAGCVELDALEVLHPRALAREIEAAIGSYRDPQLPARLEATERGAIRTANDEWHAIAAPVRAELDRVRAAVNEIASRYRERLANLNRELQGELTEHRQRLRELRAELETLAEDAVVALPARPEPAAAGGDESGWLYHSDRHWYDQLQRYRAEKAGGRHG